MWAGEAWGRRNTSGSGFSPLESERREFEEFEGKTRLERDKTRGARPPTTHDGRTQAAGARHGASGGRIYGKSGSIRAFRRHATRGPLFGDCRPIAIAPASPFRIRRSSSPLGAISTGRRRRRVATTGTATVATPGCI